MRRRGKKDGERNKRLRRLIKIKHDAETRDRKCKNYADIENIERVSRRRQKERVKREREENERVREKQKIENRNENKTLCRDREN